MKKGGSTQLVWLNGTFFSQINHKYRLYLSQIRNIYNHCLIKCSTLLCFSGFGFFSEIFGSKQTNCKNKICSFKQTLKNCWIINVENFFSLIKNEMLIKHIFCKKVNISFFFCFHSYKLELTNAYLIKMSRW